MKVLYACSECTPFVKTGGLADVAGSLPNALKARGCDIRVILPLYDVISAEWREKMTFLFSTEINLSWRKQYCGVFSLENGGVTYYFLDNEYYFKRGKIYGEYDDAERFGYFSRAVVELLPQLGFFPDIIHCNDWQTALIPIYLRYNGREDVKSIFTIHNIEYQGRFSPDILGDVFGLPQELYDSGILRYDGNANLMKGGIYKSDFVTTVSPSYASELRDPEYARGLHNVIESNSYKLTGILNGLDTNRYDPKTDPSIAANYSADNLAGKAECKKYLCELLGFDYEPDTPIIACVSRLVGHKGFDLVDAALDEIVEHGARVVILGTGEEYFEGVFRNAERRHSGLVSANIMYDEKRSMQIYCGADMFLMPSASEPCGLSQMIAMRYGTVPIVREVGGLKDTVHNLGGENANGFSFREYSAYGLLGAVDFALRTYREKGPLWHELMLADMTADLSWNASAGKYLDIYNKVLSN